MFGIGKGKKSKPAGDRSIDQAIDPDILISSIADGVVMVDKAGVIQIFNAAAEEFSGWRSSEAIGLDHKSVMLITDNKGRLVPETANPFIQCFNTGEMIKQRLSFMVTNSKKLIEISLIVTPIKDGDEVNACVGIFRDISEERSEERQRAEFISTASHEMRTPVAAIEGYLALAMNEKVAKIDSNARKYLEKAKISTSHLGKLFQDLLTAARSEDGRLTNNPRVIEVGAFLDELTENMRFTAEKKGLRVEFNFTGTNIKRAAGGGGGVVRPIYYIHADPERMREVMTNLFDNAVKYTDEGKITIGMVANNDSISISVSDTGAGIPKEDLPHLFQKFYRVDSTATRTIGGTGLGLFISRKIIELYNGTISVESELDKGSTFTITVPKLNTDQAEQLLRREQDQASPLLDGPVEGVAQAADGSIMETGASQETAPVINDGKVTG